MFDPFIVDRQREIVSRFHDLCRDRVSSAIEAAFPYGVDRYDLPEYRQIVRRAASSAARECESLELTSVNFDPLCGVNYYLNFRLV